MGLFRKKKTKEEYTTPGKSVLYDEKRVRRIASLETERTLKEREIEELLYELGKKSGKSSIYNKKRLK